ncbi:deoxyribose-phosphate aldolase [Chakrabartyella piscis]|uniref:deoxyribose-phosphate aldolase n=1 Tax=Chakrabartyella piscis TaxID=2918914 RepID=UPI0029589D7C|nr:deoxyribose-phosphate aldolase [Chakrabartyella piscis]
MDNQTIQGHIDHTILAQGAVWEDVKRILEEGIAGGTASACIPPAFVKEASEFVAGKLAICTVIGFPNGYATTKTKVFETEQAVLEGADEIDMVINIGWAKAGKFDAIEAEINAIKVACQGKLLKVIIETCLLTDAEKIELCKVVSRTDAEYIKTSTGFGGGGATLADIQLFAANVTNGTKIKAAGGIKSKQDAIDFLEAGADRLGTSSLLAMLQKE